ncbi:MAG: signal peptidase I [Streptococcaceae bacterium]|jgi:signal peptidase I|nr:signal peptidase I [Streptococcaceae bacterium]
MTRLLSFFRCYRLNFRLKELVIAMGLVLALIVILLQIFATFPTMAGYGMNPTLYHKERVVVLRYAELRHFRLIAFRDERTDQVEILRLIGLPGETVTYRADQLMINGQNKTERFLALSRQSYSESGLTYTEDMAVVVPAHHYLLLGDNRPYAVDSRSVGMIREDQIIGVAYFRFPTLTALIGQ